MHDMSTRMTREELAALRDLRAGTMLRLEADRIHREFVTGTLDQSTALVVERAVADLGRLGEEIARSRPGLSRRASGGSPTRSTRTTTSRADARSTTLLR